MECWKRKVGCEEVREERQVLGGRDQLTGLGWAGLLLLLLLGLYGKVR